MRPGRVVTAALGAAQVAVGLDWLVATRAGGWTARRGGREGLATGPLRAVEENGGALSSYTPLETETVAVGSLLARPRGGRRPTTILREHGNESIKF